MFGVWTTIPLIITIISLLAKSALIIRRDQVQKENQTTRRYHLALALAFFIGAFPFSIGVLNGIYFDLLPEDPYLPLVFDRISVIGAFLGIILISAIFTWAFIRESFLLNISKTFAKKFQIPFNVIGLMSGCPLIVEGFLFAAKIIKDGQYLMMVRYIALGGSIFSFLFVLCFLLSIHRAIWKLSNQKKVLVNKMQVYYKFFFLSISTQILGILIFVFYTMALFSPYRSNAYILSLNLAGSCIGLSALCMIEGYLLMNSILMKILNKQNESIDATGKSKVTSIVPVMYLRSPIQQPKPTLLTTVRDTNTKIFSGQPRPVL